MADFMDNPRTATLAVLSIPTLVEQILMHVDVPQLFAIQRVCKAFQILICNTRALRLKMCLIQAPLEEYKNGAAANYITKRILNPLLSKQCPSLPFKMFNFESSMAYGKPYPVIEVIATANVVLRPRMVPNTVMHQPRGSWKQSKLTNTNGYVYMAVRTATGDIITPKVCMSPECTIENLAREMTRLVQRYCRSA
jgi:hypothetical protein